MAFTDIVGSENKYLYSEDHSNAAYVKNHMSVGTTTEAPGGLLGNKIIPSAYNSNHFIYQNGLTLTGPQTFSVFAKSGGYNFIKMYMSGSNVCSANFNLSTGVVGTTGGTGFGSARIQNAGDGWYRCELTITANISSVQTSGGIYVTSVDGGVSPYAEAGDGTSGVFLFGNQLESGTGSSTYIKTEGSARSLAGSNGLWQYENAATVSNTYPDSADGANSTVTAGVRSYNKPGGGTVKTYLRVRKKGQINLQVYSENFDNAAWTKNGTTVSANSTKAPDETTTAETITTTTSTGSHNIYDSIGNSNGTYSYSVYLKANVSNFGFIGLYDGSNYHGIVVNLSTGTITSTSGTPSSTNVTNAGNGWYRLECVKTITANPSYVLISLSNSGTPSYTSGRPNFTGVDESIFAWGVQVNEGANVTPYIKTGASASTTIERGEVSKTYYDNQ